MNACEVCWTNSWMPIEKESDADGVNILREPNGNIARCDHCWQHEFWRKQNEWLNEGIALLMAVMNGRGLIAKDSAEMKVYEEWRKRGRIIAP